MSDLGWCPFCRFPMMALKTDCKGRPYATCQACSTRTFFKRQDAYNNFLGLMKDTEAKGENGMLELIAVVRREGRRGARLRLSIPR